MSQAEAVATIEAMHRHDLSVTYWWGTGWTCRGLNDVYDPKSEAPPSRHQTVIDAVADWMLQHGHPWPVRMSECV